MDVNIDLLITRESFCWQLGLGDHETKALTYIEHLRFFRAMSACQKIREVLDRQLGLDDTLAEIQQILILHLRKAGGLRAKVKEYENGCVL